MPSKDTRTCCLPRRCRKSRTHPGRSCNDAHVDTTASPPANFNEKPQREYSRSFPRIAKDVKVIRASYDCVVIGSGYGGGVAAARMARAGMSVCLLERGEERWPGEYPVESREIFKQFHSSGHLFPGRGMFGNGRERNATGMFHFVVGQGQSAMVCNGLGGGSLINANVFLEADPGSLAMDFWPTEIRENPACLNEYYQKVRSVLEPEPYPHDWPMLKKMQLFSRQAKFLGMEDRHYRVPQTTRFRPGLNSCGVSMSPSTLTGMDSLGLNDGSKTTTLVTYLADAWNWGAEMFCQCEVRHIEKAADSKGGYLVYFAWHGQKRRQFGDNFQGDLMWVHAKKAVFLGAGAIGTTEILLRSKAMGLGMSECVGQSMSGNGDMLAFGRNIDSEVNALGNPSPKPDNPVGPTITSIIDSRGRSDNPLDDFVLEEGAIPEAISRLLQATLRATPSFHDHDRHSATVSQFKAAIQKFVGMGLGRLWGFDDLKKTCVFLVMTHDSSQATLRLVDDQPCLQFVGANRSDQVKNLNRILSRAAEGVGGTLVESPFSAALGGQQISVHPLGGAHMSRDNTGFNGVTNHVGEVFIGTDTMETHDGLIVVDGAAIPSAIGVNPLATIAALAERAVAEYAKRQYLVIDEEENGILDLFGHPARGANSPNLESGEESGTRPTDIDIDFTELLCGFVHNFPNTGRDDKDAYNNAYRTGKGRGETARLFLSIAAYETNGLEVPTRYLGVLTGTFVCPTIEGSPFMVVGGDFGLFTPDDSTPQASKLTYEFDMTGTNGRRLHFHGYKVVDSSVALSPRRLWKSTTTLYITISELDPSGCDFGLAQRNDSECTVNMQTHAEHTPKGCDKAQRQYLNHRPTIAIGLLKLKVGDIWSQICTLTPTGRHLLEKARKLAKFVSYFTCKSASSLFVPLAPLQYPTTGYRGYANPTPPTESFSIVANDGVATQLHMWEPDIGAVATDDDGRPVQVENLLMIPGAAVDQDIFALPTIPFNAVNYFTRAGYRVFVIVHRIGRLATARGPWTTYDARLDIKAGLEHIRRQVGEDKIYTIAHCMGSVAFASGLLDGTIPADWILGITCSQVFMHPVWSKVNRIKASSLVSLSRLYNALAGPFLSTSTSEHDVLAERMLNQMLRFYPGDRREMCSSAACHRTSLLFGRCWNHRNLNEATHHYVDRILYGANMNLINLLARMGRRGCVSGNAPTYNELTTAENIQRLRGIPFLLFSGLDSDVLSPIATEKTYETLCNTFGTSAGRGPGIQYRRRVVPGYGHLDCWMGRNAWHDIFPFVRREVDRVVRGETYTFRPPYDKFRCVLYDDTRL